MTTRENEKKIAECKIVYRFVKEIDKILDKIRIGKPVKNESYKDYNFEWVLKTDLLQMLLLLVSGRCYGNGKKRIVFSLKLN